MAKPWLPVCVTGLAFVAPFFVVSSVPPAARAHRGAPSVLAELRTWVAAQSHAKDLDLSSSIRSGASDDPVVGPSSTAPATAAPAAATRRADGQDDGSGCAAALAYLAANAAPGFVASCPHPDGGYQATTTCVGAPRCQPGTAFIWIEDPCPAAYMNEASNSWVIIGESDAPIDPYGYCGEPGDPYG